LEGFKALLQLLAGKIATREELEKLLKDEKFKKAVEELVEKKWEEVKRELEERIAALEKEVKEMRKEFQERIRLLNLSPGPVYIGAEEWPYVEEVGGEVRLKRGLLGDGPLVYNSLIDVVAERLRWAAERGGGVVVVKGGKGVGKSTAAVVAVYHLLRGAVGVGERVYKPIAIRVKGNIEGDDLQDFVKVANSSGYLPVFYFDPSKLSAYPRRASGKYKLKMSIRTIGQTIEELLEAITPKEGHAVVLIVLSTDQYQVIANMLKSSEIIDADKELEKKRVDFIKALVKSHSSDCTDEVVEGVAEAIFSHFVDNYAVAAVLAADWLKRRGCRSEEVERAVKEAEGNVHRFVLHYLWYGLFNKSDVKTKQHAPLLLAVGLFGPHPPKLAEAIVRAFDGEPEDAVVRWFSQPLHGTIFDAIKNFVKCVHKSEGAIVLCKDDVAKLLIRSIQRKLAENEERTVEALKQKIVTTVAAHLSSLVDDFTEVIGGRKLESLGRWVLKSQALGMTNVFVEEVYDRLDILLAVLGIASLRVIPPSLEEFAKEWVLVSEEPAQALSEYLLAALRTNRGALCNKVAEVFYRVRSRGYLTQMDAWEVVGLLDAVGRECVSDEEVKFALRLSHYLLREYKFVPPETVAPSLQRLLKVALSRLDSVAGELAFLYRRYPIERLDPWTLYDKVNDVERVFVLQGLLRQRKIGRDDLDKIEERVKELENGDVSLLLRLTVYPMLAKHYAEVGERRKAEEYIKQSFEALSSVGPSSENLRQLLSSYYSPFEFERWVAELPLYVYINDVLAYLSLGEVQRGLKIIEEAWNLISALAPNEHVVVKALEAYLVALAYRGDKKFDKVVEEYSKIVGCISDTTYSVLKMLNANIQKIDKVKQKIFDISQITLIDVFFATIALVMITKGITLTQFISRSEVKRLALVKFYYDAFLNGLLYI